MSSKFKFLSIVAVALLATGIAASTAFADVTGTFGLHISIHPQTTAT
ncbi:hypothetical protein HY229_05870, partial [Candidatus Acetothermia bacterium]|nr:hypothetical protein [Candidatus Acetothermia bacterium]MBI1730934.1 hypothetical protein [Candidatus Acetothermia bacterium]MBI3642819.1 hypothetical protein [Candidatus Acetothermia bacterium]MBI3643610.1 hypothetical protein [Candidatus Acetothermia bacterium]